MKPQVKATIETQRLAENRIKQGHGPTWMDILLRPEYLGFEQPTSQRLAITSPR